MKKLIVSICAFILCVSPVLAYSSPAVSLNCNGVKIECDTNPVIVNNRTLVPFRAVFEALGANVNWDAEAKEAYASMNGRVVSAKSNCYNIVANGIEIPSDICVSIMSNRVMVPLRALCEALGCNVKWNEDFTIDIDTGNNNSISNDNAEQIKPDNGGSQESGSGNNNAENDEIVPSPDINENIDSSDNSFEMQVFELINIERAKYGLSALKYNSKLAAVAEAHSADMAKNNYFSHTSLSGLSPFDRIRNAGISYRYAAENIAAGQQTPQAVVQSWMNSSGHRQNILNGNVTETGIGCVNGGSYGIYWTQAFIG